jgi:hypothetical protein
LKLETSGSADEVTATATFDLGRLAGELARFVDLGATRLAGQGQTTVTVRRGGQGRFTLKGESQLRQLELAWPKGGLWQEDSLTLQLQAAGNLGVAGRYRVDSASLHVQGVRDDLTVQLLEPIDLPQAPLGKVQCRLRGDLAQWQQRLQPWVNALDGWQMAGSLSGQVELQPGRGRLGVTLDLTLGDLTVGPPASPSWREPRLRLLARVQYDRAAELLQVERLHVESQILVCDAEGQLARLGSSQDLSLTGRLAYDLEKLEPYLRPYLGNEVKVTGHDERPFRLAGSLAAAEPNNRPVTVIGQPVTADKQGPLASLTGEAAVGWKSLQAHGCQAGPADLRAQLAAGWLRVQPVECALHEGRLRLEPSLRLEPGPTELYLAKGTVIDRARITPAMCASALGYAVPVLAGVTEAEGQVSLALDGGRVPLAAPSRADLAGRFTLHAARVGPSPLLRELSVLLKGPADVSLARESVVPFRVVDGRVYHSDLELVFPELTVRTHGSVGLDGSLALVAEMPVPPRWLPPGRLGSALAKQTVRLLVGGILQKPKIDEKALQAASARFARDAAGEILRQELDGKLQKLLRPPGK